MEWRSGSGVSVNWTKKEESRHPDRYMGLGTWETSENNKGYLQWMRRTCVRTCGLVVEAIMVLVADGGVG